MDYTYIDFHTEMVEHYYRAGAFHTVRNPQEDATSGNHHCINATYHLILKKSTDNRLISKVLLNQEKEPAAKFINSTRNLYDWFDRHPKKMGDRQAHDDNIGIIVSSKILGLPFPQEIYDKGNQWTKGHLLLAGLKIPFVLKWYYTNLPDEPQLRLNAWHGRFPWLVGIYNVGVGKSPGFINSLAYAAYLMADVYFGKDRTATSGKILKWLANDTMKGQSKIIDWAINKWENYIKEMYPGQMGEVLGIYHGVDHPFSKAMWGKM